MRRAYPAQPTSACPTPDQVPLNLQCRDEIIPILRALQHIYSDVAVRKTILDLVGKDVNRTTSSRKGRPGLGYWEIIVLAAVRLGCNLDYDKLQNLAEEHRTLRLIMGISDWQDDADNQRRPKFDWRTIRDNLCFLRPKTLEKINLAIVKAGHALVPTAIEQVRGDTFVVETNVHYPTESTLIGDGLRKVLKLASELAKERGIAGWRQHEHWHKIVRAQLREIARAGRSKGAKKDARIAKGYRQLLATAKELLGRAKVLLASVALVPEMGLDGLLSAGPADLQHYVELTEQVCGTAKRRVLQGESVPHEEKLFSIFEPHTELIKRGKQPNPIQFGHNVIVMEDAAGFICYYRVVANGEQDVDLAVLVTKEVQKRFAGKVKRVSFDRGYHSPENQKELAKLVDHPCLAPKGKERKNASVEFRESRRRHPGVESAIGALQAGNGMERCRDRSKRGYERYVGLGILGRNLHVLGKLLIGKADANCQAAKSKRQEAA